MKILTTGHKYELASHEGSAPQILQFIEKRENPKQEQGVDKPLITVNDGTTNEEVLAMLIDRIEYLNLKIPCRENSIAITKLQEALLWLERRTALRRARGVEGLAKQ